MHNKIKKMKNNIIKVLAFFTSLYFLYTCDNNAANNINQNMDSSVVHIAPNDTMMNTAKPKENNMMRSMMVTMAQMDSAKMTSNFDIDFANTMMIHHQAAIDMSELEIAKGGDVKIIDMAKNIITSQKAEIAQLKNFVSNYKIDDVKMDNSDSQNILADAMKRMMDNMHNMKMTGNTDDDFVMLMIPHHASAVKMAKNEITYGKEPMLKKIAQKIIIDQNKEIATFVAWSTKLK
jgi:uncharacterized protein (DUF305 family)